MKKKMWALFHVLIRGSYFRFDSIFIKKSNQIEIFLKKKTETGSNRNRFRFGSVFRTKTVQTSLARFFRFSSVFFWFCSGFFSFFLFGFSFFGFRFIKPNRTSRFFKILIDFYVFFTFRFFRLFFFWFFGFFTPS